MTHEEAISTLNELIECTIDSDTVDNVCYAIIEFLESLMPHILTRAEMEDAEPGTVIWCEQRDEIRTYMSPMIKYDDGFFENRFLGASPEAVDLANTRFWSGKPTEEQRKAAAWHEA